MASKGTEGLAPPTRRARRRSPSGAPTTEAPTPAGSKSEKTRAADQPEKKRGPQRNLARGPHDGPDRADRGRSEAWPIRRTAYGPSPFVKSRRFVS